MRPASTRRSTSSARKRIATIDDDSEEEQERETDFKKGTVVRLQLNNFMTYKTIEVIPGPFLNVIIGPNGSGKSALVCGLIVGLAGDTTTTGRSSTLLDYIRYGCDSAFVEIELKNNRGNNHIIRRQLVKTEKFEGNTVKVGCKSEWIFDGKPSTQAAVRQFVQHNLNINVDNLCQFLPQERVVEFVKMDALQLLEATEKAAGDPQMFNDHQQLKLMSKEIIQLSEERKILREKTQEDERNNERVAEEIERVRERKRLKEELKIVKLKKPWLTFDEKRVEFVEVKKTLDHLRDSKKKKEDKIKPFQRESKKFSEKCEVARTEAIAKYRDHKKNVDEVRSSAGRTKTWGQKVEESLEEFKAKLAEFERKQTRIQKLTNDISEAERCLEEYRSESEIKLDMKELDGTMKGLEKKAHDLNLEKNKIEDEVQANERKKLDLKRRIAALDTFTKRRQMLNQLNRKANQAIDILDENKAQFAKTIYPSLLTQIDVKPGNFAKFVESCIPKRDLCAFICEDPEDMKKFSALLRDANVKVPLIISSNKPISPPYLTMRELKTLGFTDYVSNLFNAPAPITEYLCNQYHLHEIPVGTEMVETKLEDCKRRRLRKFYSPTTRFSVNTSKYDGQHIVIHDEIQEARFLTIYRDDSNVDRLKKEAHDINEKIASLNDELVQIEKSLQLTSQDQDKKRKERTVLKGQLEDILKYNSKILKCKADLAKIEALTFDKEEETSKIKEHLKKEGKNLLILLKATIKESKSMSKSLEISLEHKCQVMTRDKQKKRSENKVLWMQNQLKTLEKDIRNQEKIVDEVKEEAKKLRRKAEECLVASGYEMGSEKKIPDSLKQKFDALPDNLNELEAKAITLLTRLENMSDLVDERAEADYNRRSQEIKQNKKQILVMETKLDELTTQLTGIKERWLPPLNQMITKISDNFTKFMVKLGYAGEVVLKATEDNFSTYGLVIRVKYRNSENVQDLSAFHQSGGERSVATVIYMMALQELTKVPFRCVDEINQGMDSINERKVFDLIVDTAVSNEAQYFLLSPKLPLGLTFTDKMTFHSISNGLYIEPDWLDSLQ